MNNRPKKIRCPKCKSTNIMGQEYIMTPEDYDGVSEWICIPCGCRWGRWSGKILRPGELEKANERFK